MSIADKITRLQTAKDNIADAIIAQGGGQLAKVMALKNLQMILEQSKQVEI